MGLYIRLTTLLRPGSLEHKEAFAKGKEDANRVGALWHCNSALKVPDMAACCRSGRGDGSCGMIPILSQHSPDAHFLVTSGTRQSADVFSQNLPERTLHQYLPLMSVGIAKRSLRIGNQICAFGQSKIMAQHDLACRSVWHPQVVINARMNAASFNRVIEPRGCLQISMGVLP